MSRVIRAVVVVLAAAALVLPGSGPALAHGFTSTVYVSVIEDGPGKVRTALQLEYDLYFVSAADAQRDDPLFRDGDEAFQSGDAAAQSAALDTHGDSAVRYVTDRFTVSAGGKDCAATRDGAFTMGEQEGVPYATLNLIWDCARRAGEHTVRSTLFGTGEGYVKDVKTLLTYEVDGRSGTATLDASEPSFSTGKPWYRSLWVWAPLPVLAGALFLLRRRRA